METMSADSAMASPAYLEVPGEAADHLYREGSAKASFWEAVFGSSLRAKRRTHVSAQPDGTRMFDVPLLDVEDELLRRAQAWMCSEGAGPAGREASALIAARGMRVRLIGLQPRGHAMVTFTLRFEPTNLDARPGPAVADAFRRWFQAEGTRVSKEALTPFGFVPF